MILGWSKPDVAKPDTRIGRRMRWALAIAIGVVVAPIAWHIQTIHSHPSDFAQVWYAARALLAGNNPYEVVGPGRPFPWPFPLLYPLTALITAIPFAAMPLRVANMLWVACSAAILGWGVTRERLWTPKLWVFASWSYFAAAHLAQWSPLLTAAAFLPWVGFALAAKPTIGAALFVAYPSRRALISALALAVASLIVFPSWPVSWIQTLHGTSHMSAPVAHLSVGGPLILLSLIKWKRPEARLLAALACVPQTTLIYEAVPLFLVVNRWYEGLALSILSFVVGAWPVPPQASDYNLSLWVTGDVMVLSLYLPCVVFVLTRPNHDASWDCIVTKCGRALSWTRAEPAERSDTSRIEL
jgi:hypothetical protein